MIIGIVGFAGSGKGTVGDILVNDHDFTKLSFADAVKDATSAIFGWPRHLLEGDTNESRQLLKLKHQQY
jgi:ABC-type oligopeptide transport system ATPase subunit